MKIGIVPNVKISNNPYEYKYSFINSYCEKLINNNAVIIGILLNNNKLPYEILSLCDGFLFPGGIKLEKFHFEILLYAIKNKKRVLGICLGMQVMAYFGVLIDLLKKDNMKINIDNLWKYYNTYKNESFFKLKNISTDIHGKEIMQDMIECNLENINKQRHNIIINENSTLYNIYKTKTLNVISLHLKQVKNYGSIFNVSAKSEDGVIEALEYYDKNNFICGVQYHPELDDNKIFQYFLRDDLNV